MEKKTKAMIGAAAGVATAATVAGIVASRRSRGVVTEYRVAVDADGWTVSMNGSESPAGRFGTKREAVAAGRKLAAEKAPSELVIQRTDGTIQDRHAYGIED